MSSTKPIMQSLRSILKQYPWMAALTLAIILAAIVAALYPPLILGSIVDSLSAGQSETAQLAVLYFVLLAAAGLLQAGQNVMITRLGQKIMHGLRSELAAKLHRLPASYFTAHPSGEITSRFVNDVDAIDTLFTDGIISMFANALTVVSILWMIFTKSRGLGILLLLVTPLLFLMTRAFQRKTLSAQLANRAAIAKVSSHIPETIRNIRMIRSFQVQRHMEERYDSFIEASYEATDRSNLFDSIYSPIIKMSSASVIAVMMVLAAGGGRMQAFFGLSVGTAVAVIAYVNSIFDPLENIGMEIQTIQAASAGLERITDFLSEPERTIPENMPAYVPGAPCVEFRSVSFRYRKEQEILHDLSFRIQPGEHVTFIGRTGAGKSTIFRLITDLYEPQSGEVLIHGISSSLIPDRMRRSLCGVVEQDFHPVMGTVRDQVTLFSQDITSAQVERAVRLSGLEEAILQLPKGYDTPFRDTAFSKGQLQLLSIARALAAEPEILLLDEFTANLDSATEEMVMHAISRAAEGRTVISISHRLNSAVSDTRMIEIVPLAAEA